MCFRSALVIFSCKARCLFKLELLTLWSRVNICPVLVWWTCFANVTTQAGYFWQSSINPASPVGHHSVEQMTASVSKCARVGLASSRSSLSRAPVRDAVVHKGTLFVPSYVLPCDFCAPKIGWPFLKEAYLSGSELWRSIVQEPAERFFLFPERMEKVLKFTYNLKDCGTLSI